MSSNIDRWLAEHGLEALSSTMRANDIDLDILGQLSDSELSELGISIGNRKRILNALASGSRGAPSTPAPAASLSERRQVTILFADIVGFTRISDRLDPEETHRLLGHYFEVVDRIVTDFGGSIDKHIGDAVMAVFGAPKSHGNDAERAVRAASAIHEALSKFEPRLEAHIGVAGGEVLASRTGSQDHAEYTVTGPSVNLASRLQGIAAGGETLISESVYQAISAFAVCENRGEIQVKGLSDSLRVWCLKRMGDKRDALDDRVFVGRRNELQQAFAILDGVETYGHGGVLYIRGEAGIGKTRFADQLEKRAQSQGIKRHTGLILDFGVAQGEDAITLIMRSLCSVPPRGGEAALSSAVEDLVDQGAIDPSDKVHATSVLGAPQPPELKSMFDAMDNEARKAGRLRVIASLLGHASGSSPLLLRVEDVHWADEATLQALAILAAATTEHPIVLLMTSRFEGDKLDHNWRASARNCSFSILDLGPLRKDDALAIASSYLSTTDTFARKCIERAAGNPLFLEQLLRSKENEAVPGSVQSIVQARLDQLNPTDADALRAASVLGQRFSLAAVRAITGNASFSCGGLVAQQLVRPEGEDYLFTHALVRDGVYQSIVITRRKELHGAAAGWFGERDLSLRAWHLGMAGDESAPTAYLSAAKAQADLHRYDRAIELCKSGLSLGPPRPTAFALLALLGEVQSEANEATASIDTFTLALQTAESAEEKARSLIGLASGMRLVDRMADAEANINEALAEANRETNHPLLANGYFLKGNLEWAKGNYNGCITNHQAALEHARAAQSVELEVQALGGLGDANYLRGRMITANQNFVLCAKGADEAGLGRVAAANRPMLAWCAIYNGEFNNAWERAIVAREEARSISHSRAEIIALNALVLIAAERGDLSSIFSYTDAGLALARKLGSKRFQAMILLLQSKGHFIEGQRAKADECLKTALELSSETLSFIGPWILGGLVLTATSSHGRSQLINQALTILHKGAVSHNHLFFHADVIDAYLKDGNWQEVRGHAEMLAQYTADEPLPWASFMIERARWAASIGEGERNPDLLGKGRELLSRGRAMGLKRSLDVFTEVLRAC